MSDNLKIRAPEDRKLISLREPWEVKFWTHEFGVTEAQLRAAVNVAGHSADKVRSHLKK